MHAKYVNKQHKATEYAMHTVHWGILSQTFHQRTVEEFVLLKPFYTIAVLKAGLFPFCFCNWFVRDILKLLNSLIFICEPNIADTCAILNVNLSGFIPIFTILTHSYNMKVKLRKLITGMTRSLSEVLETLNSFLSKSGLSCLLLVLWKQFLIW